MIVNVITNLSNQVGLQKEAELLTALLTNLGHEVHGIQYDDSAGAHRADVNIFDEVLVPNLLLLAPHNWVFPHPEWWFPIWNQWLMLCERILAKTHDTAEVFSKLLTPLAAYRHQIFWTGFLSSDLYDPAIQRERAFLHVAGRSDTKNTDAVVSAWARCPMPAPLTVVAEFSGRYSEVHEGCGITFCNRVDSDELRRLYNSHQFFLLPSAYEGWGHALHEAMGCGALVLTTNAPPMSEFGTPACLLIPPSGDVPHGIVKAHQVSTANVQQAVTTALSLPPELVEIESHKARQRFLDDNSFFKKRFQEVLANV